MAFQQVPDTMIVQYVFDVAGSEAINDLYIFDTGGSITQADVDAVAAAAETGWTDHIKSRTPTDARLNHIFVQSLDEENGVSAFLLVDEAGTNVNAFNPMNVAALTKFRGAGGGLPTHGWVFFPFVRETDSNLSGQLDSGAVGDFNSMWSGVLADLTGVTDMSHVIVSRYNKALVPTPPHKRTVAVTNFVNAIQTRQLVGSQRDRRAGIGS